MPHTKISSKQWILLVIVGHSIQTTTVNEWLNFLRHENEMFECAL